MRIGKTCFADFGTPSFCFLECPGGLFPEIIGSKPLFLFCSLQISMG